MFGQHSSRISEKPLGWKQRFLIPGLKLVGFTIVALLIIKYFRTNVSRMYSLPEIQLVRVTCFMAGLLVVQILYALLWMLFIRGFGYLVTFKNAFISTYYPVLTKYLPGKGWFQVGRIYLMKKANIKAETGVTINILEQLVVIYTGLLVSSPLLVRFIAPVWLTVILIIATILMLVLLFYQDFFTKMFMRFGRFFKISQSVSLSGKIRPGAMFYYICIYTINWMLWGFLFWLEVNLLDPGNLMSLPLAVGSFTFSSIVGFIIPITPAGLGIREGALLVFLEKLVNPAVLFNATIGIRLCTIIGEIIMFLIALILKAKTQNA